MRIKYARLQRIIHRRESLIIIRNTFRLRIRTIGPVIIGAAGINPLGNFCAEYSRRSTVWGSVIVSAGYFISAAILAPAAAFLPCTVPYPRGGFAGLFVR